jgi:hypothetical protein
MQAAYKSSRAYSHGQAVGVYFLFLEFALQVLLPEIDKSKTASQKIQIVVKLLDILL